MQTVVTESHTRVFDVALEDAEIRDLLQKALREKLSVSETDDAVTVAVTFRPQTDGSIDAGIKISINLGALPSAAEPALVLPPPADLTEQAHAPALPPVTADTPVTNEISVAPAPAPFVLAPVPAPLGAAAAGSPVASGLQPVAQAA